MWKKGIATRPHVGEIRTMSDEQDPPALSLRPRKKPVEDEAAAAAKDTQAEKPKLSLKSKTSGDATEAPTLSLKPKSAEPAPATPAPAEPAAAPTKPRVKPKLSIKLGDDAKKEPVAAQTPAPAPEAEKPAEPAPEAKPRLKPKLSLGTDAAAEKSAAAKPVEVPAIAPELPPPPSATESDPAVEEAPVVEHRDETNPAVDPAVQEALKKAKAEKPKLKLNISKPADTLEKETKPASAAVPPDLPPPPGKGSANLPPPVPVVTDDNGKSATTPPMPLPEEEDIDDDDDDDSEAPVRKRMRPEQRPIFKIAVILIGVLLVGAIGAGGYMVYNMMFGLDEFVPPAPSVATTPEESPPVDLTGASSLAGKMIEKAQNAADAIGQTTEAVKEAAGAFGEDGNEADDALSDAEALVSSPNAESPSEVIDNTSEPVTPTAVQPTQAFQDWVSGAVISGVREGSEPRAFINNLLVKIGDPVDAQLGITFDNVDAEGNLVIFKDRTGAIVGKRY